MEAGAAGVGAGAAGVEYRYVMSRNSGSGWETGSGSGSPRSPARGKPAPTARERAAGPGGCCSRSPRHRTPFAASTEGSAYLSVTLRAICLALAGGGVSPPGPQGLLSRLLKGGGAVSGGGGGGAGGAHGGGRRGPPPRPLSPSSSHSSSPPPPLLSPWHLPSPLLLSSPPPLPSPLLLPYLSSTPQTAPSCSRTHSQPRCPSYSPTDEKGQGVGVWRACGRRASLLKLQVLKPGTFNTGSPAFNSHPALRRSRCWRPARRGMSWLILLATSSNGIS